MSKPSIYTALYSELLKIRLSIKNIDKEKLRLEAKREALVDREDGLRLLMMDYGKFVYEGFVPNENEEASDK